MSVIKEHNFPIDRTYDMRRKPWIYDEENGYYHIGPPGAFHQDLVWEADIPYKNTGGIEINDKGEPIKVFTYNADQKHIPILQQELGLSQEEPENPWAFGAGWKKKASHELEWRPGSYGKGWVFDDGTVWNWPINPEDMRPYHSEKLRRAKGQGLTPMEEREITPESPPEGWLRHTGAFHINPEGILVGSLPDRFVHTIKKADPRISTPEKDNWEFG